MNLKAAANVLEVHYQTAYKWVRSGELTAIRVGGRYDISESAINRFLATRRSTMSDAATPPPARLGDAFSQEDVLEELEVMTMDPIVSTSSVLSLAARRGAAVLGDICLVARMDDNGRRAEVAVDHPDPDRAAFVSAALDAASESTTRGPGMAEGAFTTGLPVRVRHVPQDLLRQSIRPELQQYLATYSICSLLSAPIGTESGTTGFVAFTRDTSADPYTVADEEFAVRLGTRIGWLFETARQIELASQIRREVFDALNDQLATRMSNDPPSTAEIKKIFLDHPTTTALPVAVLDDQCRIVTTNETFAKSTGHAPGEVAGRPVETFVHPDECAQERRNFDRLLSGEVDYLDIHGRKRLADGTHLDFASHRVAMRRPDDTLHCIVTVLRPLHTQLEPADPAREAATA